MEGRPPGYLILPGSVSDGLRQLPTYRGRPACSEESVRPPVVFGRTMKHKTILQLRT